MEYLILNEYKKHILSKYKGIKAFFKDKDRIWIASYIILLVSCIIISVIQCWLFYTNVANIKTPKWPNIITIMTCISTFISAIVLFTRDSQYNKKHNQDKIRHTKSKYKKFSYLLYDLGYTKPKQIQRLLKSCQSIVSDYNNPSQRIVNVIDKYFTLFLIPALGGLFSLINKIDNNLILILTLYIQFISILAAIYTIARLVTPQIIALYNLDQETMKMMVNDLRGIVQLELYYSEPKS